MSKYPFKKIVLGAGTLAASAGTATAGMGADAATALTVAQTEGLTAGVAVVALVAAMVVVKVIIGLIRKAGAPTGKKFEI